MSKRKSPKRIKTGLAGAPLDGGYMALRNYFYSELEKKDYVSMIKEYIRTNYDRTQSSIILSNPDYSFNFFNYAASIYWLNAGFTLEEGESKYKQGLDNYLNKLLEEGEKFKVDIVKKNSIKPKAISPMERLKNKVQETIGKDFDLLKDDWMDLKRTEIDVYSLFKQYDLKGISVTIVSNWVQKMYDEYSGAYNKECPQLVESYSFVKRTDLKWYMTACQTMLDDLSKLKAVRKSVTRTKKVKTADKQVAKVKYKINDSEYKLESINPVLIVGTGTVYLFNTKSRKLQVYITESLVGGLQVSSSSITGFDEDKSFMITLRKPDEVLQKMLTLTPAKVKKYLESIKAKKLSVSGRINTDMIILRAVK